MAGISAREISDELIGSGSMSSEMPCDFTRSRRFRQRVHRPRVVHLVGRQAAADVVHAERRQRAKDWLGIPLLRAELHLSLRCRRGRFAGALATCAETTASARAPADMPPPASRTNSRRFTEPPDDPNQAPVPRHLFRPKTIAMVARVANLTRQQPEPRAPAASGRERRRQRRVTPQRKQS